MKIIAWTLGIFLWVAYPINAQKSEFGAISIADLEKTEDAVFPNSDAVILFQKIYFDYGKKLVYHERVKIYTTEGFEHSDRVIPFEDVYNIDAATYNLKDGEIVTTKVSKSNIFVDKVSEDTEIRKLAFPNVQEGSIIELKYSVPFIGLYKLYTQDFLPIKMLRIDINNPDYLGLKIKQNPYVTIPIKEIRKDYNYLILGENIPPLKNEKFVGNINNHRGQIILEPRAKYEIESWTKVSYLLNRYDWFGGQLKKRDRFYEKEFQPLLKGITDSLEMVKKIDRHLKSHFKWNGYLSRGSERVKTIYRDQEGDSGDINLLYAIILRSLGFDAYPMVVATKGMGWVMYPRINAFNSMLCTVVIDGKRYLLDATREKAAFAQIPLSHANDKGLIVYEDNSSTLYPTLIETLSHQNYLMNVSVDPLSFSISGSTQKRMTHYFAWDYREKYSEYNGDYYSDKVKDQALLTFKNQSIKNLGEIEAPVMESYDFEMADAVEEINGKLYLEPLLYLGMKENIFNENDRLYPVDINYPYSKKLIINIAIPEGYALEYAPAARSFKIDQDYGFLEFNTLQQGNLLQVMLKLQLSKQLIPAEYYDGLKQLFVEVTNISNEKVILSRIP